ncbi:MAG: 4-hydroxythreonine-4-phosphate dehydrogenase PdxA [Candidatus Delongbacteria bacterium]|jgi:4-hydroxythreonine-4-phosphate dehydrogenase|nr:4-hydroxythreonine-4-phosphate dehydrogenase PdxA [Candidatus Delongbacteria bacterium]
MKKIFITQGDVNGIGNELILKYFAQGNYAEDNIYTIIGSRNNFNKTAAVLNLPSLRYSDISNDSVNDINVPGLYFLDIPSGCSELNFGKATAEAGKLSGDAIKTGVELAHMTGGALVTCPINKYSFNLGGYNYPGHTEFIAELLNTDNFLMILDGGVIKVALVTTHLAIKDVPAALSSDLIYQKGRILSDSLRKDYGIESPEIAVLSLNPHAGDGGLFGDEEALIIAPAVARLNEGAASGTAKFTGPLAADTAFTRKNLERTDAFLVMYHDQGLIPLKLLSFGSAVNFTAGLPIVRTSPDHGTAYDIAGKGVADINSFKNAVEKALYLR